MRLSLLMLCVAWPAVSVGAPPPGFLRLHAETRGFMLGRPAHARLTPDGKTALFLRSAARSPVQSLYAFDVASGQTRELCTADQLLKGAAEQLSPEERARRERMRVTARGFTSFEISEDGSRILTSLSGRLYTLALGAASTVTELPTGDAPVIDPRFSPDATRVAYVKDRDLYVLDVARRKELRLTRCGPPGVTCGVAEFVAQEELERDRGYWWSPDGKWLAYEEADSRKVETFHLGDPTHPERAPEPVPYPRPGKQNAELRVGVIAAAGGPTTWLSWDRARFPYLAQVVWSPGAPLTLVVLSRDQRELRVLAADVKSGKLRELVAEHDDAWINLDKSVPRWLPDGSAFAWSSERGGAWQLELRDAKGALVRALGRPEDGYRRLADLDDQTRTAWFEGGADPTEIHLHRVSLDGGAAERMTQSAGVHTAEFARRHGAYLLRSASLEAMPRIAVIAAGKSAGELPSVAEAPPFSPKAELYEVGAERWRARVIRPRDFDPKRKYPVVIDVYGGPHHQQVMRSMSPLILPQWIADHGFVVVAIDGRGTPGRGRAWERAIGGNLGKLTLDDQVAALRALGARLPELDLSRVGIYGWSFGGYLAARAVLARPDVFAAAVAGAPVVDWRDYDTAYTERYLGMPAENAAGYDDSSLLGHAAKLERPLLLIHGTRDDNVYFFHTLKLADALFRAGKRFELLPLPGLTHMVPDASVREALWTRIVQTLVSALRP
jgi:dipeptidyl-peptidase 4